jgi:hypothetical protein
LKPNVAIRIPEVYNIPLRSMYSRNVSNLFMAGRNISATHVAFTSARVMATCSVIGQAVGTAAAHCVEMGVSPRQLAKDPKHLTRLRQTLLRDDQTIKGVRGHDPLDLAKSARITASAEASPTKASLVTDGLSRDIPDKQGDPVEYHHWAAPLPAWIELEWDEPKRIREVQITFDTGFKRELMLTAQDSANINIVRAPQPETVRDYVVTAGDRVLATVNNNHQRVNRVHFEPVETKSVRIAISATNGIDQAHIFEVRCYA